jgi:L-threonylcarbamoyladenylate synthase
VEGLKTVSPREAGELLGEGLVALAPTETVVGLVAAEAGLDRLWRIKGRDPGKPIALLCASPEEAFAMAADVPSLARKLAALFWPGPLTLVLDRPGGGTVGLRVPDHPTVGEILAAYGRPLYATSANLSGEPAPSALKDVNPLIVAEVDLVVEGEPGKGEASAVVDLSDGQVRLLRPSAGLSDGALAVLAAGKG